MSGDRLEPGDLRVPRHKVPSVRRALEFWRDEAWRRNRAAWPRDLAVLIAEAEVAEQAVMFDQITNGQVQNRDTAGSEPVEWITADEAARRLGCDSSFVCRLCREEKLRSEKAGKSWLVDVASVNERAERLGRRAA